MTLTALRLSQFRSWPRLDLSLDARPLAIHGPNGSGKTNILEALSMLAPGRGLRAVAAPDQARMGPDAGWRLRATLGDHAVETAAPPGQPRHVILDDKPVTQTALARLVRVIWLVPAMDRLWSDAPEGRRRFLDSALCQVYRPYLVALRRYMRLTAQKNALLKSYDITPNGGVLLDTYDEQLAEYGALIMDHRCKFLAAAAPIAAQNYKDISHGAETLELHYQMCTPAPTADALLEKLHTMRPAELRAGFCLAGPHREDLEILLDGQPARVYGSQGQQRSCVLAMKLAEATVVGDLFGEHPVLLLDDVLSELDDERQTYLLTRMGEHQTIVTTCDTAAFARTNGKIVMVKGGTVAEP